MSEDKELFNLESRVEIEKSLKQVILYLLYLCMNNFLLVSECSSADSPQNGSGFGLGTVLVRECLFYFIC